MKNLILLFIIIILSSCDVVKIYPENKQESATTTQILNIAQKDSILYKKVVIEGEIYFVNTKTNLVEVKAVEDDTPAVSFIIILGLLAGFFILGFVVAISND